MVSSTVGSPTSTGWKRRSRAASFSMCLRYSSSVVAPMQCSSPRASIGFSMLEASIAPSAAPAPTTVCSSSMKRMISPSDSWTSLSTAFSRSSNSPRYLAPAISAPRSRATRRLFFSPSGTSPLDDPLGQSLDDGRLADAGLADQHRVVLGPAREHLDHAADLLVAADHRVELALAGQRGQVAAVLLQRLVLVFRVLVGHPLPSPNGGEHLVDLVPGDPVLSEDPAGGSLLLVVRDGDEQVLGADVLVLQPLGLLLSPLKDRGKPVGEVKLRSEHLWLTVQLGQQPLGQPEVRHAQLLDDLDDDTALLLNQGEQEMLGLHLAVAVLFGEALARDYRLLRLLGEFVDVHRCRLVICSCAPVPPSGG